DGLAALGALATPTSTVDRERLAAIAAPTGWIARSSPDGPLTEGDVVANLEFCAGHFDRRHFRYIHVADGYQRAAGDWDANPRFPHGHRWLTDRIHGAGFLAGLWVAPFAVTARSGLPAAHPAWLLKRPAADGSEEAQPVVVDTRDEWGGAVHALDGAHPEVQQWLYDLARQIVRDWGYDYLEIDYLHWAMAGGGERGAAHYGGLTDGEAYRRGLAALRDGLGTEAYLLAARAPWQHAVGLVSGMRIGPDVQPTWFGVQPAARAAALRSPYHRATWLNHPGALVVRPPLTVDEARAWAAIVAASGGATFCADDLPVLPADRLPLLQKTFPVPAIAGRPVGTQHEEHEVAPAVVAGEALVPLVGPWRFRTGDDPRYAARDYDAETWETVPAPGVWERSGHPDYDGRAWYRVRFTLPPLSLGPANAPRAPAGTLEL
ncbi:MAG: alpha-galactosidase, partial [Gemmatimonadales bacterium]